MICEELMCTVQVMFTYPVERLVLKDRARAETGISISQLFVSGIGVEVLRPGGGRQNHDGEEEEESEYDVDRRLGNISSWSYT